MDRADDWYVLDIVDIYRSDDFETFVLISFDKREIYLEDYWNESTPEGG